MSDERVAIVTAASRGMGRAIAERLGHDGWRLVLMSSSGGAVDLAKAIGATGMRGSVTDVNDLEALVGLAVDTHGRVDAVVNCTGHPPKGDLLSITDADWHAGMDMVLLNVVRMARLVTPIMRAEGGGAIVNISTFAAFEPNAAFPVSAALRAALAGFTKLYADQHAADGIRMNNVLPGFIDSYPETEAIVERIPMGRYGAVGEVAGTVAYLLSDDAGYVTGQNLRVDGGLTRSV